MEDGASEARAMRKLTAGLSSSSANVYFSHVKRFKRWCDSVQGLNWPPRVSAVDAYAFSLIAGGASPTSVRNATQVVSRYLALLHVADSGPVHQEVGTLPQRTPVGEAVWAATTPGLSADELILASLGLSLDAAAPAPRTAPAEVAAASATSASAERPHPSAATARHLEQLVEGLQTMLRALDLAVVRTKAGHS